MARVKVRFVAGPVGVIGNRLRIDANRAPEIGEQAVNIVDRLELGRMRTLQQDRARSEERLDIMRHIAERAPHLRGHVALSAKPGEGSLVAHAPTSLRNRR